MTAIDWASKPEPWRSVGLAFCEELAAERVRFVNPAMLREPEAPKPLREGTPEGDRLRDARNKAGLPLRVVAAACGVSITTVSDWELGKFVTRPMYRPHLCAALGVVQSDIWPEGATDTPEPKQVAVRAPGETLRALRVGRGLSTDLLAAMAGLSEAHLCKIESGAKQASLGDKLAIADALGLGDIEDIWS
jgi:transcriptional regulator with XRE-family HTH domain